LAKFQVSDPSGSIFKKFPKIAHSVNIMESAAGHQVTDWCPLSHCY
jgi:hypothetical protein